VPRNVRTYDHFCLVARALEDIGDRWSLLVIRDLLTGAKRFTDLMERLGGITPKTLTQRLRELADAGLVEADREAGRREVWYRLTPAGADLGPVVDALSGWGLRHAWRWPQPGEPLHAEHLLRAVVSAIELGSGDRDPARWHLRVDGASYLIECADGRWSLSDGASSEGNPSGTADVTVTATTQALIAFIFGGPNGDGDGGAGGGDSGVELAGEPAQVERFRRLIATIATVVQPA
jgi:DNA-binding HxlR family transcriptional regulator